MCSRELDRVSVEPRAKNQTPGGPSVRPRHQPGWVGPPVLPAHLRTSGRRLRPGTPAPLTPSARPCRLSSSLLEAIPRAPVIRPALGDELLAVFVFRSRAAVTLGGASLGHLSTRPLCTHGGWGAAGPHRHFNCSVSPSAHGIATACRGCFRVSLSSFVFRNNFFEVQVVAYRSQCWPTRLKSWPLSLLCYALSDDMLLA